ncbi:MAG: T9SS type A sorting domain-containing protein, partial [Bacteroidota bacterium]
CFGGDGSVTVSATGGTSPYSGDGTFSVPAGTYNYTVTDANGCTASCSATVNQPAELQVTTSRPLFLLPGTDCDGGYDVPQPILCYGGSVPITVSAIGGTGPYTGAGTYNQSAGTTVYTVTDANGCVASTSVSLSQPAAPLSVTATAGTITCGGGLTNVTVSATGGTPFFNCWGYSYSGTGTMLRPAGTHSFTVTDWHGCTASASVTITQPDPIVVNCTVTEPTCYGENGTVLVEATGTVGATTGTGTFSVPAGEYYIFNVTDANGCISGCTGQISQPAKVEALSTSSTPSDCGGATGTATVVATGGTGSYTYLWSPGGQTSATATGLTAGMYTVQITDGSGCSGTASIEVTGTGTSPAAAGPVIGPSGACRNSTIVFSIDPVANASEYQWMLPGGASGTSTSNTISVSFGPSYAGGFICVTPISPCGTGASSCINVPLLAVRPARPVFNTAPAIVCGGTTAVYSVIPVIGATSYSWTVTGVSILSGQGTSSITVSVPAGFGQGSVRVDAVNCIGNSPSRAMAITGLPFHSYSLTGPIYVCAGTNGVNYSIGSVTGADTYAWTITGDATVVNGNGPSATVNFGPSWTSGNLTVTTTNTCGAFQRTFTIRSVTAQPGGITGQASALCNGTNVAYSISPVAGATSYSWSVPAGSTIATNSGTAITVNFGSVAGNICVIANNACGASPARCLAVTLVPAQPATISGPASVCKSSTQTYSVASVSGASIYNWTVTGGAAIAPQGTSAIVNFNSALSGSASVKVSTGNACGFSPARSLAVVVNLACRTAGEPDQATAMTVFPNPARDRIRVQFASTGTLEYLLKVSDLLGKEVAIHRLSATEGRNEYEIDLSGLERGIYLFSLMTTNGTPSVQRVIIE